MSFILYKYSLWVIWTTFIVPLSFFHFKTSPFCVAWKKETPTDEHYNFQASHSFKCNFSLANFINGLKARSSETKKRRTGGGRRDSEKGAVWRISSAVFEPVRLWLKIWLCVTHHYKISIRQFLSVFISGPGGLSLSGGLNCEALRELLLR